LGEIKIKPLGLLVQLA